ncbi:hypothetical protein QYE76_014079 [Lolium multiflorum]|uniref:Uncharacterized protein n=1 Tax=Lolium multiflorum TaxID=4521 RepID=A0AAD8X7U0_LOLMU|nr:hypothetical protein QYE76_014079 [Lolium multiflorum]
MVQASMVAMEGFPLSLVALVGSAVAVAVATAYLCACVAAWVSWPRRVGEVFRQQGIDGPPPSSFLSGNLSEMQARLHAVAAEDGGARDFQRDGFDDYCKRIFPYFDKWRKAYGDTYLYWLRQRPALYVTDPELISEIGRCVSLDMGKPKYLQKGQEPIFGAGILKSNGACWARQRKVISPEFYMAKVRGMVPLMVDAAQPLLRSWEAAIDGAKGGSGVAALEVDADIRSFSFDVISRACFGTDHSRGKEIFLRLRALSGLMAETSVIFAIPSLRYLPTAKNRRIWRLTQEIRSLILELARGRRAETAEQRDFLGSIIESSGDQPRPDDFVVDNCKNIFFAGHETSAVTATWCLMLLAAHPEWQERARAEVLEVCGAAEAEPDLDMVSRMKTLGMVVQETLRLFPPSSFVVRETFRDMRLGRLHAPKGTYLFVPISAMHHDAASWGPTSRRFDPGRFKDGVAAACKNPQAAFMPFGLGARTCLGQNLAIVEVKTLLAVVLARFAFTLSPDYRHSPAFRFIIEPEFGLRLLIRRVGATQDGCN